MSAEFAAQRRGAREILRAYRRAYDDVRYGGVL